MTTNWQASASEGAGRRSTSFGLLAEPVRRWIWQEGWGALRPIQERAIPAILAGGDVILSAATAGGKTEAAFLPLVSRLVQEGPPERGFGALYLSPLKALINDQFRRLEPLCERAGIAVHPWHGDISAAAKRRARETPGGIVQITPESLEALFVRRGSEMPALVALLKAVVIDELHAFIGTERGVQLASLLRRMEVAAGRRIDRIGLSATLGDMALAAEALRPGDGAGVRVVEAGDAEESRAELKAQLRGYRRGASVEKGEKDESAPSTADRAIGDHLFGTLRGTRNLVFAGSRRNVEFFADMLRQDCEDGRLPNEFLAHHGSLSKEHREEVERRLRDDPRPATAICTSTLELGIDIGAVESVAQIGPPVSVAALRQRLGRSGRREGRPAVLRIHVAENEVNAKTELPERLRLDLVQAVAVFRLLLSGWCEPPVIGGLHLSTLVHQILSAIAQHGGLRAESLHRLLLGDGPFGAVTKPVFIDVLRAIGREESALVEQGPDGTLHLGREGERLMDDWRFYAVFPSPEEWRIEHGDRILGTLPVDFALYEGQTIVLAGRRWTVTALDAPARAILVAPSSAGLPPRFGGDAGPLHDRVAEEMRRVYCEDDVPLWLNATAKELLEEGRAAFRAAALDACVVRPLGAGSVLFPWAGTRRLDTLVLALLADGVKAEAERHCIRAPDTAPDALLARLSALAEREAPDPLALAAHVEQPATLPFEPYLTRALIDRDVAAGRLDVSGLGTLCAALAGRAREDGSAPRRSR